MKTRGLIAALLGLSLGLLGLVGYLAYLLGKQPESISPTSARVIAEENKAANQKPGIRVVPVQRFTTLDWRSIESTNYTSYIGNLRRTGCPEETIRDIVIADINKEYGKKRATLVPPKEFKYWLPKSELQDAPVSAETRAELRQLEKERRSLIRTLLGVSEASELQKLTDDADQFRDTFGFLNEEKQSQIRDWQEKFEDREQEIRQQSKGVITPDDEEQLAKIREEQRQELGKILSVEELEQYEMRTSEAAEQLRSRLIGLNPTEEEFKALYKLQREFDQQSGAEGTTDGAADQAKREKAEQELDDRIVKLLGADRATSFRYSEDKDYQALAKLSTRFELPKERVLKVHDLKSIMEEQAGKIYLNGKLTTDQKERALAALKGEMEKAVEEVLGEKPFRAYQRQGGQWLEEFSAPPEPQDLSKTIQSEE